MGRGRCTWVTVEFHRSILFVTTWICSAGESTFAKRPLRLSRKITVWAAAHGAGYFAFNICSARFCNLVLAIRGHALFPRRRRRAHHRVVDPAGFLAHGSLFNSEATAVRGSRRLWRHGTRGRECPCPENSEFSSMKLGRRGLDRNALGRESCRSSLWLALSMSMPTRRPVGVEVHYDAFVLLRFTANGVLKHADAHFPGEIWPAAQRLFEVGRELHGRRVASTLWGGEVRFGGVAKTSTRVACAPQASILARESTPDLCRLCDLGVSSLPITTAAGNAS